MPGKTHPSTAISYNNIGAVYYNKNDYKKALNYMLKAMKIREKKLGEKNSHTKGTYAWRSKIYDRLGDNKKAQLYRKKAK